LGRIINPVPEVKLRKLARINVSITGADPANVVIATSVAPSLVNAVNLPLGSNNWRFYFDPTATSVVFDISAPDRFPYQSPEINLSTGYEQDLLVELGRRTVTVNVTTSDGQAFTPRVEFQLPISNPFARTDLYQATAPQSSPFSVAFPSTTGPALPDTGQARVKVSAPGYRANEGETSGAIEGDMAINVTLRPLVTISGTLTSSFQGDIPVGSSTVVKASDGTTTHTATVQANGSYSFPTKFDIGTWRVTASVIGWGQGQSAEFVIGPDSPLIAKTVDPIPLTPRDIETTLDVNRPDGADVSPNDWDADNLAESGATVTLTESGTLSPTIDIRGQGSMYTRFTLDLSDATLDPVFDPQVVLPTTKVVDTDTFTLFESPVLEGALIRTNSSGQLLNEREKADAVYVMVSSTCSGSVNNVLTSTKATFNSDHNSVFEFPNSAFDKPAFVFDPDPTQVTTYCINAEGGGNRDTKLPIQISVANDGLSLVINPQTPITPDRLKIELGTPSMSLVKSDPPVFATGGDVDRSGDFSAGDILKYTVTATNTGPISLTNVDVGDPRLQPNSQDNCGPLGTGGVCVLVGTYTVRSDDVGTNIVNTATATSDQINATPVTVTTPVPAATMTITQPPPANDDVDGSGDISVGDTLTYTITARNTGAANLTDIVVDSSLNPGPAKTCGATTPVATNGTCVLTFVRVIVAGDFGATIRS
ncbi:MAG: hypothetical protein OEZ14_16230, partial [Acidimicrobiia bacterium]|nr:hypothetical protein [Acidimicrobiia bacterium]